MLEKIPYIGAQQYVDRNKITYVWVDGNYVAATCAGKETRWYVSDKIIQKVVSWLTEPPELL